MKLRDLIAKTLFERGCRGYASEWDKIRACNKDRLMWDADAIITALEKYGYGREVEETTFIPLESTGDIVPRFVPNKISLIKPISGEDEC